MVRVAGGTVTIQPGAVLGGYRIVQQVGRGGMGVVYQAEQIALGRRVALKVIAPELASNESFRARFERESRMAAAIDHVNIVPVYEAGTVDGLAFIAMRFIDGIDLATLIARQGRLAPEVAVPVVMQVGAALDAAHAHGLVHRDVKPGNVLVTGSGETLHCYLTDFGLTKDTGSNDGLTATGQWLGTPNYVAPEQIEGRPVDARADIYALGCILYECLTGSVPFPRDSDMAKLYAHAHEPPPLARATVPGLPPELDGVVVRGLAKKPDERYPSAGDLARAARAACQGRAASEPERSVAVGEAAAGLDPRPTAAFSSELATGVLPVEPTAPPPPAWTHPQAPSPTPPQPYYPTVQSGGKGGGTTAIAVVAAAIVLAVAGVAAALIATQDKDSNNGNGASGQAQAGPPATQEPEQVTTQVTVTEEGQPPSVDDPPAGGSSADGLTDYSTDTYSAKVPDAWENTQDYERQSDGRRVSKWQSPSGNSVLIDTTLGVSGNPDPADSAQTLHERFAGKAGYERLEFGRLTLDDGTDAFEWSYVDPESGRRKIDVFFFKDGNGYAVLGETSAGDYDAVRDTTIDVAGTVG
jgi:serine/threonine protein kinase